MLDFQHTIDGSQGVGSNGISVFALGVENHPEQYLGKDLPGHEITAQLIREIFEDFIQASHITEEALLAR